ncbi:putative ankyrin repeat protein PA3287 [Verrucomicrobiota bacterium]|nr:putative ankyrin repeat protein PA3287 [Verrucomicrobiota bacterium]
MLGFGLLKVRRIGKHPHPMGTPDQTLLPEAAAELARQGKTEELSALLKQGLGVDLRDAKGNTLLMLASYHGKAEVVRLLLKSGATVDLRNAKGQTPLGGVAFKGYADIATLLLDAGADPLADQGGSTPVDYATLFGRQEILVLLRERRGSAAQPTRWFSKLIGWVRKR